MPDYTYPFIFPNLQENPRDLETWLSSNVVSPSEGGGLYASATHQHADAIRISTVLDTGGSVPTSEGELGYVEISEGLSAGQDVLLDMTVHVEVQNVPAGQYWGCRAGVQSVEQGVLLYHQGQAHTHTVSVAGGDHAHTASSESAGSHRHEISLTTGTGGKSHTHPAGTLAVAAASGSTGTASSSHQHGSLYSTSTDDGHNHAVLGWSASGGSNHTHSLNAHTHGMSGSTEVADSNHDHTVSGYDQSTGAHSHTVTVNSASHSHTAGAAAGGGGLSKDMIAVRYIGTVNTGESGVVRLSAHAVCSGAGATWTKVQFVGAIWVVPSVLASQLGGLDDVADVSAPAPSDGQVLTWSAPANSWIAEDAPAAAGAWAGRMLLMGG